MSPWREVLIKLRPKISTDDFDRFCVPSVLSVIDNAEMKIVLPDKESYQFFQANRSILNQARDEAGFNQDFDFEYPMTRQEILDKFPTLRARLRGN